jgi:phosphatidylglycerophosphate synthase
MTSAQTVPRSAIVSFGSSGAARRRIAGVAAAARIVRELAQAGVEEAWLLLPPADSLDARATADLRRLAGPLAVRIGPENLPAGQDVLRLTGDRLVFAEALRRGDAFDDGAIRLDGGEAEAEILRRTGKAGDGPVSRTLNRPISRSISALLLRLEGVRPIHATLGTALLATAMFAALLMGGASGLILGGLLFQAASIFDGVDGEIARATFRASDSGAMLDNVIDIATNLLFILGVTVNLAAAGSRLAPMLTAWAFALFLLGLAAVAWRASRMGAPFSFDAVKDHYRNRFQGRLAGLVMTFFIIVSSRDFFALLFPLLILVGVPMAVLYIFALAASIWIFFVLGSIGMRLDRPLAPDKA